MSERKPCLKCQEQGRDQAGDNLIKYSKGWKCFSCNHWEPLNARGGPMQEKSELSTAEIKTYPIGTDPARKVSEKVSELYQVRNSVHHSTGQPDTLYYPYKGGYKVRKLATKKFHIAGSLTGLFGQEQATQGQVLIITEGEEDALAAKTIFLDESLGVKVPYDVVSLPNGVRREGNLLDNQVMQELEFLKGYKRIFLCLDADEPGKNSAIAYADWLAPVTEVRIIDLTEYKDASDYLVNDAGKAFRKACKEAKVYEPEGIVCGSELDFDTWSEIEDAGSVLPYPQLQDKLKGLRKGEITTLAAGTGIGKSTFSREIGYHLWKQGKRVAMVALEDQMTVSSKAMVALDMNIPLPRLRFNPPPASEVRPHFEKVAQSDRFFFWKHFGGMQSDKLMQTLTYYARSKGCDFIVLDHFSDVVAGMSETNERRAIDQAMKALAKLVVETGVGLIMVVHLSRSKDKNFNKGDEVELSDLRGSAAIEQYSWSIIGLERNQQGDDTDFSQIRVLKNRTFGFTGLADTIKFDALTGRLKPFVPEAAEIEGDRI